VSLTPTVIGFNRTFIVTGSTKTGTVTFDVNPKAPTNPSAHPPIICSGGFSWIKATVGIGETIDWYSGSCNGAFVGSGSILLVSPGATTTYYGKTRHLATGCVSSTCTNVTVSVYPYCTALNLKVFFEGFHKTNGYMARALDAAFIPKWGADIVDTFSVELHDASNYSNIIYTSYGVFLDTLGNATLSIPPVYNGYYYVTVNHRNHISAVSAGTVDFSSPVVNYNFADNASNVYGSNIKNLGGGIYGLYCGDIAQEGTSYEYPNDPVPDGMIDMDDLYYVFSSYLNGDLGYRVTDFNGDGMIDIRDVYLAYDNYLLGIYLVTP